MTRRLSTCTVSVLIAAAIFSVGTAGATPAPPEQRPPVVVQVGGGGFHWGDAAIGAAATLGLTLAASGLVLNRLARPRTRRKNHA